MPSQQMPTAGTGPIDRPDNHGPIVSVVLWFLMAATVLSVIVRIATKSVVSRKATIDDLFITIALLFSIAQSIAVSFQVWNGLGRHVNMLTSLQLDRFQQSAYASDLSFILNLASTKLSILFILRTITPIAFHRELITALAALIALWALASEFTTAFQCSLPHPWAFINSTTCIKRTTFWTSFGIFNILTDLVLVLLPLSIAWRIQVSTKRKAVIAGCFAARALVTPAIVTSLVYMNRSISGGSKHEDPTFDAWPVVLANQVVQNLGIVTACIPYLKPFFESLGSGMIRTDDLRRRGVNGAEYGYEGSKPTSGSGFKLGRIFSSKSGASGIADEAKDSAGGNEGSLPEQGVITVTTTTTADHGQGGHWDADSQRSESRMINETRKWKR